MDLTAIEQELGEPVSAQRWASFPAMSKGYGKKITARSSAFAVGGLVGFAAAKVIEKKLSKDTDGENAPAGIAGEVYVALTPNWLAICEHRRGVLKSSVGELRAKIERSQIASCRIEPKKFGFSPLTIGTADGTSYELEVAMAHKGKAQKLVESLGAPGQAAAA